MLYTHRYTDTQIFHWNFRNSAINQWKSQYNLFWKVWYWNTVLESPNYADQMCVFSFWVTTLPHITEASEAFISTRQLKKRSSCPTVPKNGSSSSLPQEDATISKGGDREREKVRERKVRAGRAWGLYQELAARAGFMPMQCVI